MLKATLNSRAAMTLALLAPTLVSGTVWVVAPSGAPFTHIQAAVDAAAEGDTVLVKSGAYSSFHLTGRALSVVADQGANVIIYGAIRVRNCTGAVLLSGLAVTGQESSVEVERFGLSATDNSGSVRIEHCTLRAATAPPSWCNVRYGASVIQCSDVAFTGCTLEGSIYSDGRGDGLHAEQSSIAIHDSIVRGGNSVCGITGYAGVSGGDGLEAVDSFVFAEKSQFAGGSGGYASCGDGGAGGDGVKASGATTSVVLLDCVATGGAGGPNNTPFMCPCSNCLHYCTLCNNDGAAGDPTRASAGASIQVPSGIYRRLDGANVVREATSLALTFYGQAGEQVAVLLGRQSEFVWTPALSGVQLVAAPTSPPRYLILGTLPASGMLNAQLPIRSLPVAAQSDVLRIQALFGDSAGTHRWSGPLDVIVLDSAF